MFSFLSVQLQNKDTICRQYYTVLNVELDSNLCFKNFDKFEFLLKNLIFLIFVIMLFFANFFAKIQKGKVVVLTQVIVEKSRSLREEGKGGAEKNKTACM